MSGKGLAAFAAAESHKPSEPLKIGCTFGALEKLNLKPIKEIIFGLGRGQIGILVAQSNVGKSTMMRLLTIHLCTGRAFPPFGNFSQPKKVALLDFEDGEFGVRSDIQTMAAGLNLRESERELLRTNLYVIADAEIKSEPLCLSRREHREVVTDTLDKVKPDLIIIDTVVAAFSIFNENDNSEMAREVVKPLRRMAVAADAAVIAIHHIGKSNEQSRERESQHRSRGASSLTDASKLVVTLTKDGVNENSILLHCAKAKRANFEDCIFVREGRQLSLIERKPNLNNYARVTAFFRENPNEIYTRKDLDEQFSNMSKATITRCLDEALKSNMIAKEKHGKYRLNVAVNQNAQMLTDIKSEQMSICSESPINADENQNAHLLIPNEREHLSISQKTCEKCGTTVQNFTERCKNCGELPTDI